MKRTLFSIAAILCASFIFSSCSKDVNSPDNGDAQALTSVFTLKSSDWAAESGGFSATFDISEITASITDQGAVWIYYSFNNGTSYELAPALSRTDQAGNAFDLLAEGGTDDQGGYALLTALSYNGNTSAKPNFSPALLVKVVSIPSSLVQAHPNVNKSNYNEVKSVFRLK